QAPGGRQVRRRRSGTKQRLVSVFAQGLAVLMNVLMAGHALRSPSWEPEPWLEFQCEVTASGHQPPTPIPKNPYLCAPEYLGAIVERAMARDPRRRYQSARAMAEDLERYHRGAMVRRLVAGVPYPNFRTLRHESPCFVGAGHFFSHYVAVRIVMTTS